MTLKEKVAEVEPSAISKEYDGGVRGCPYSRDYLGISYEDAEEYFKCIPSLCGDSINCTECWNRPFKGQPSNENVSTESKLHQIATHLDSKSYFSVEYGNGRWYVECWTDGKLMVLHNGYADNLEETLNEIIRKLEGK